LNSIPFQTFPHLTNQSLFNQYGWLGFTRSKSMLERFSLGNKLVNVCEKMEVGCNDPPFSFCIIIFNLKKIKLGGVCLAASPSSLTHYQGVTIVR